eukprot:12522227-Alexandrium_andersonii.AAC.1
MQRAGNLPDEPELEDAQSTSPLSALVAANARERGSTLTGGPRRTLAPIGSTAPWGQRLQIWRLRPGLKRLCSVLGVWGTSLASERARREGRRASLDRLEEGARAC